MFFVIRETAVLGGGVIIAIVAAILGRQHGRDLDVMLGIVLPIIFCLARLACVSRVPGNTTMLRYMIHQLSWAFALIMLFLFELGVGLFILAKDIPFLYWGVIAAFATAYLAAMYAVESLQTPQSTEAVVHDNHYYIQRPRSAPTRSGRRVERACLSLAGLKRVSCRSFQEKDRL